MAKARETADKLTELEAKGLPNLGLVELTVRTIVNLGIRNRSATKDYSRGQFLVPLCPRPDAQVYGRLKVIAGLIHSNDQVLVNKLSDLQSNALTSLRATYEAQATIEAKESQDDGDRREV